MPKNKKLQTVEELVKFCKERLAKEEADLAKSLEERSVCKYCGVGQCPRCYCD